MLKWGQLMGKEYAWGIRSMDDVVTVGTYTKDRAGSYERAVQKLESLAYHESMELERTDDDTDGWPVAKIFRRGDQN